MKLVLMFFFQFYLGNFLWTKLFFILLIKKLKHLDGDVLWFGSFHFHRFFFYFDKIPRHIFRNYRQIIQNCLFVPFAVETLSLWCKRAVSAISSLRYLIAHISADSLYQKISEEIMDLY